MSKYLIYEGHLYQLVEDDVVVIPGPQEKKQNKEVKKPEKVEKVEKPESTKKKVDKGKAMALLKAGWTVAAVADELNVHITSIYPIKKEMEHDNV